jgi:hypothetical protein
VSLSMPVCVSVYVSVSLLSVSVCVSVCVHVCVCGHGQKGISRQFLGMDMDTATDTVILTDMDTDMNKDNLNGYHVKELRSFKT